jgi:acetyl esterase/lipase
MLPLLFFSCNKDADSGLASVRKLREGTKDDAITDSMKYYARLMSPTRDIERYVENGGKLPDNTQTMQMIGGGGCGCNGGNCNGINILPTYCSDPACDFHPLWDPFMNRIWAVGTYGTADERQKYYVYYPANKNPNSPVVLLIHGGGWFSGPNPDEVQGFPERFAYDDPLTSADDTINLVNDLLNQGYVVVSMIYRLVKVGNNNTDILSNNLKINNQIEDVNSCVNHIKNNFPTCLNLNVNSLQVLGESAGGLLALDWAYTYGNSSYLKSAISYYTAMNFSQYATYIYSEPHTFICGDNYYMEIFNNPWHFPFYPFFIEDPIKVINVFPMSCSSPTLLNATVIDDGKDWLQSAVHTGTLPVQPSSSIYTNYSPITRLTNSSYKVPTFLLHGKGNSDKLVPYTQSNLNLNTTITSNGGFVVPVINNTTDVIPPSPSYATNPKKHMIKLFNNADHGFFNATGSTYKQITDSVRSNTITWLNGHK